MTENYHVIRDTVAPTISMSDVTIKDTEAASYNLMTGVSVADNSGVTPTVTTSGSLSSTPGTYTITYTVRDAAGNVRTASRNITVEKPYDPSTFTWTGSYTVMFNGREYGITGGRTTVIKNPYVYSQITVGYQNAAGQVKRDTGLCLRGSNPARAIEDEYGYATFIMQMDSYVAPSAPNSPCSWWPS